jgi:hypothetical protein
MRNDKVFRFEDYAEPGRLFQDQEYFARTAPRVSSKLFNGVVSAVLIMAVCCAVVALGRMLYLAFFKRY